MEAITEVFLNLIWKVIFMILGDCERKMCEWKIKISSGFLQLVD